MDFVKDKKIMIGIKRHLKTLDSTLEISIGKTTKTHYYKICFMFDKIVSAKMDRIQVLFKDHCGFYPSYDIKVYKGRLKIQFY